MSYSQLEEERMAKRSTRNKIKYAAERICNNLDNSMEQLYHMEVLGAKRLKVYKEQAPLLFGALQSLREAVAKFRSDL